MSKLNASGEQHALRLIAEGKYEAAAEFRFAEGEAMPAPEFSLGDQGAYALIRDGKVYATAIRAIRIRAAQNSHDDIFAAAGRILDAFDKKQAQDEGGDDDTREVAPVVVRMVLDTKDFDDAIARSTQKMTELNQHAAAVTTRRAGPDAKPQAGESTMFLREARVQPETINLEDRTAEVIASTGARVRRRTWDGSYDEVLEISKKAVRLDRMNQGAPLLDTHDYWSGLGAMLGAVVPGTARVEAGKIICRVKFSRDEAGERAWQNVRDGILRHVSLGYVTHKEDIDRTTDPETRTATDWEPHEISCVPMPADPGAGFRSFKPDQLHRAPPTTHEDDMTTSATAAAPHAVTKEDLDKRVTEQVTAQVGAATSKAAEDAVKNERIRSAAIREVGAKLGMDAAFVEKHITEGTEIGKVRELAIEDSAKRSAELQTQGHNPFVTSPSIVPEIKREMEKGEQAARILRCVASAKRAGISSIEMAKNWRDEKLARALAASVAASGGVMVQEAYANEIIELLRPLAAVRSMSPTMLPMPNGNITIPRLAGGAAAGYTGENQVITKTEQTTDSIKLSAKKLAAIVPVSNDLLRFASYQADLVVRDDMIAAIAQAEDAAFLRGTGTEHTPKGLRYWANDDNIIVANATVNVANTVEDLRQLLDALTATTANTRMLRPGFLFTWRTHNFLYSLQNSDGFWVFRDEMKSGKLNGLPFKVTNNIPNNLGDYANESEIYLADFADVVIGEVPGFQIDTSSEAAYNVDGSTIVSAFSRDQTVLRVIAEHDLAARHDRSIAVLTGVKWGVPGE